MVVACLALAISLSGITYAVSTALPRNSVGTVQLKNNAVNSAKVKNASLRAVDFAAGQIPVGPQGPGRPAGAARSVRAAIALRERRVQQQQPEEPAAGLPSG
jgi:hypothetical protein